MSYAMQLSPSQKTFDVVALSLNALKQELIGMNILRCRINVHTNELTTEIGKKTVYKNLNEKLKQVREATDTISRLIMDLREHEHILLDLHELLRNSKEEEN